MNPSLDASNTSYAATSAEGADQVCQAGQEEAVGSGEAEEAEVEWEVEEVEWEAGHTKTPDGFPDTTSTVLTTYPVG